MAHFAELDENNTVLRVVVISNDDLLDENGVEQESLGIQVCKNIFGVQTTWVQTSYNGKLRKHFAGPGMIYNQDFDIFISPRPFPSWELDANGWGAPVPYPEDGKAYIWNETDLAWEEITLPGSKA